MKIGLLANLSVLTLALGTFTACTDVEGDADDAELVEGSDDSKADQADLALSKVDFGAPTNADVEKVGVIKSRAGWMQVFGVPAPSSIRFDREWVAYYTAGTKSTGGYAASITRVRLSDTGKSLKVSTHLETPGPTCIVTEALTTPYAIVKFAKPSLAPTTNRYTREAEEVDCGTACAGTIVEEATYAPVGTSNEECLVPDEHCLTNDLDECPRVTPLPPSFCPNGTVVTVPNFIPSADGMECELSTVHCVTNDHDACPQWSPPPPSYCPNGTIKPEPHFVPSADGMECKIPRLHCVIDDASVCPQL